MDSGGRTVRVRMTPRERYLRARWRRARRAKAGVVGHGHPHKPPASSRIWASTGLVLPEGVRRKPLTQGA